MLSVDQILDLLAHDFERYANQSRDACALTRYANSYGEVMSPIFDVEDDVDVVSYFSMSTLGGVCDDNSCITTYDDMYVENKDVKIGSIADSFSSCFHKAEIHSDYSYDEECNSNDLVYSNELFEGRSDTD